MQVVPFEWKDKVSFESENSKIMSDFLKGKRLENQGTILTPVRFEDIKVRVYSTEDKMVRIKQICKLALCSCESIYQIHEGYIFSFEYPEPVDLTDTLSGFSLLQGSAVVHIQGLVLVQPFLQLSH